MTYISHVLQQGPDLDRPSRKEPSITVQDLISDELLFGLDTGVITALNEYAIQALTKEVNKMKRVIERKARAAADTTALAKHAVHHGTGHATH